MFTKDPGSVVAKAHGVERSPLWDKVRKAHLAQEPSCVACKKKRKGLWAKVVALVRPVQVHHIYPFQLVTKLGRPDLELDLRNLITLCASGDNHHELLGHLADFQSFCINIRQLAISSFFGMKRPDILASTVWKALHEKRPKDVDKMTDQERATYRAELDVVFPKPTV
jgi:hypothetical protein